MDNICLFFLWQIVSEDFAKLLELVFVICFVAEVVFPNDWRNLTPF